MSTNCHQGHQPCGCTPPPCLIGQDDFAGDLPGADPSGALNQWNQYRGAWTTSGASGRLTTADTGARLVFTAGSNPTGNVSVAVNAAGNAGDQIVVFCGWDILAPGDCYYLQITLGDTSGPTSSWFHCWQLYGPGDVPLQTSYQPVGVGLSLAISLLFKAGYDVGIVFMASGSAASDCVVTVPSSHGGYVGLGTGATNTGIWFRNFSAYRADPDCDSTTLSSCNTTGTVAPIDPNSSPWVPSFGSAWPPPLPSCLLTASGTWTNDWTGTLLTSDDAGATITYAHVHPFATGAMQASVASVNVLGSTSGSGAPVYAPGSGGVFRFDLNDGYAIEVDGASAPPALQPSGTPTYVWINIRDPGGAILARQVFANGGELLLCNAGGMIAVLSTPGGASLFARAATSTTRAVVSFGNGASVPPGSVLIGSVAFAPTQVLAADFSEMADCPPCAYAGCTAFLPQVPGTNPSGSFFADPAGDAPLVMHVVVSGVAGGSGDSASTCCGADNTTYIVPASQACTYLLSDPDGLNECYLAEILVAFIISEDGTTFTVSVELIFDGPTTPSNLSGNVFYNSGPLPVPYDGSSLINIPISYATFNSTPSSSSIDLQIAGCDFSGASVTVYGATS